MPSMRPTITAEPLRKLTVLPASHPRGQSHMSAASGLVCAHGRVYVVADDEHHLAVFCDLHSPGRLHRILPGDLPQPTPARKRLKPDLEALLLWPACTRLPQGALIAFGSGSRAQRERGVVIPLRANGEPAEARQFDLAPLYAPLKAALGSINIEGALVLDNELVLLNRGVGGLHANATVHYPLSSLQDAIDGRSVDAELLAIRRYVLGSIDGIELGFTDAAALPDGRWVFCAAAENTADSYADGPCSGAAVGVVDAHGEVMALHRLEPALKVEGIAALLTADGINLCMVSDADDPRQSSQLLRAHLKT